MLLTDMQQQCLAANEHGLSAEYSWAPIQHLIEQQVERTPQATALIFGERQLTYRELNSHANRLAHALVERGVGAETLVGIAVERSFEMIVALLAILKAGGLCASGS